jgi:hypothetical protein
MHAGKMFVGDLLGARREKNYFDNAKTSTKQELPMPRSLSSTSDRAKTLGDRRQFLFASIPTAITAPLHLQNFLNGLY